MTRARAHASSARPTTKRRGATRFVFVRHGETDWNRRPRFRGHVDVPLNRTGIRQAMLAGRRLASLDVAAVYTSPLGRTTQTAHAVAAPHALRVTTEPGLIDMDFGTWHGQSPAQVRRADPARYRRWLTAPDRVRIAGGETLDQVHARTLALLAALQRRHRGETVVLVSHDIVGRVLVCIALDISLGGLWRVPQDNAAVSVFDHDGRSLTAVTINDIGHLTSER